MRARKLFYTHAAALIIACSPATPTSAQAHQAPGAGTDLSAEAPRAKAEVPALQSAPRVRIDNFAQVNARYYRGAQPEGRDYGDLAALGVRTIIDLQKDGDPNESRLVERAGMKYHRIPMTTHKPPTQEQLERFLGLVNDPANQPVYVHCAGGRHRTGVMTAVYRMTRDGWTGDQAFKEMKKYKYGADFLHPEFKRFVYAYRAPAAPALASEAVVAKTEN